MICLDSDLMISLLRGNEEAKARATKLEEESSFFLEKVFK